MNTESVVPLVDGPKRNGTLPSATNSALHFPKNFLWGTATSATQVEGHITNEWTNFVAPDGKHCRVACDHYHRYREDIQLMQDLGVKAYRLSIEWSRLQSAPNALLNRTELERYCDKLDCLRAAGITPMVVLHHFSNPLWIYRNGGWTNPATVAAFENFVNAGMKPISDIMVVAAATMRGVAEALPGSTPKFLKDNEALKKQMETETGIKGIGTLRGTGEFMNETRTSANALANSTIQSAEKIAADAAAKAKEITDRTLEMTKDWLKSIVGAGESVPDAMTASATQIDQATDTLVSSLRNIGQSVSPGAGINLNSSNMSRLLANFRNSTGPNDNYRQSLVDTVYRPDAEDNDSRLAAASGALAGIGTGSEISRDQMVAYETMIRQQGELIDLLQRSVGIQDKTLRATYNT